MRVNLAGKGTKYLAGGTLVFRDELAGNELGELWIAPTWTMDNGVSRNTPEFGSELLVNGDMETGDPPTGWGNDSDSVLSSVATPRPGSSGTKAMQIVSGTNQAVAYKTTGSGQEQWHRASVWQKNIDADYVYFLGIKETLPQPETEWIHTSATKRITPASYLQHTQRMNATGVGVGEKMLLDDVSICKLTLSTLFATILAPTDDWRITMPTIASYRQSTQIGAVFCLDDPADPANFVIAYCDSNGITDPIAINIEQCVAGVYTTLVTELGHTPGNNRHFSAVKIGNQLSIFFGTEDYQTLVGGAPITLPAGLAANRYHGLMSTDEGNSFSGALTIFRASSITVANAPQVLNAVFGGTSITNSPMSHRRGIDTWLRRTYRNSSIVSYNASQSGRTSWNNLLRISEDYLAHQPSLIIFDNANDDYQNVDAKCIEALVRRVWALYPDCKFVFCRVFNVTNRLDDTTINTPSNAPQQTELIALGAHYGIPVANYYGRIVELINGGAHLMWYLQDTVHPNSIGHQEMNKLLQDILTSDFLLTQQKPTSMPARLYDTNGDYENAATIKNGTAYDSITGSWTTSGTQISSSSAGATVTFSAICQSIGRPEEDGTVQISVDGGAYQAFTFVPNGEKIAGGVRGARTVTIKVVSGTVTISKFWAI